MSKEYIENLADLKVQSKILRGLVDVIFDSCRLNYDGTRLVIDEDMAILAVLKAFYSDELDNRIAELKRKAAEKEEGVDNG